MHRSLFAISSTLLLVACGHAGQASLTDHISVQLGNTNAACQGADRIVKAVDATTISRTLAPTGDSCDYKVHWSGRILDTAKLKTALESRGSKLERVKLIFDPVMLVDELGSKIESVSIRKITLRLRFQKTTLLEISAAEGVGPIGKEQTVALAREIVETIQLALTENKPLMGAIDIDFQLSDTTRRELAAKARGPYFEIKFKVDLQVAAAGQKK